MQTHSFTITATGILREIITEVQICEAFDPTTRALPHPPLSSFRAVWDTGATNSVITQQVVDRCGLKPISRAIVSTANGQHQAEVYLVNIALPNHVGCPNIRVTKADLGGADVLIGMDIITLGDFAITNKGGKTLVSYRYPSVGIIDFLAGSPGNRQGRNELCKCGSGKKYKRCCGA